MWNPAVIAAPYSATAPAAANNSPNRNRNRIDGSSSACPDASSRAHDARVIPRRDDAAATSLASIKGVVSTLRAPRRLPPGPGQAPVRAFLAETFKTRTQAEWVAWMADKDIAFAPVKTLREGLDDPQVRHREMVVRDARGFEHIGMPVKFEDEPGRIDFRLPALGEHSKDILRQLGYTEAELAEMKTKGVY